MTEIKINLYQNDAKKKVWSRRGTAHDDPNSIICETRSGVMHDRASSDSGLLVFSDDVTEDLD